MSGLVTVKTLRRGAPVQAVLLHGLFCNGGFWLPWLERFDSLQLTVLSIDYAGLLGRGVPLAELGREIGRAVGAKPAHLIAHSFGCWAGMAADEGALSDGFLSRSFICPTFAAVSFDAEAFARETASRIKAEPQGVAAQIDQAIEVNATQAHLLRWRDADDFYLPDDDPYFRYAPPARGRVHACRGGHFDVEEAVASIASRLARSR
jgi:pimeloyl-ACP methyl ester carboxylesterase